jgi:hypothetical protein
VNSAYSVFVLVNPAVGNMDPATLGAYFILGYCIGVLTLILPFYLIALWLYTRC